MNKLRLGVKVWSHNKQYLSVVERLIANRQCEFIEIYCFPDSFNEYKDLWKNLDIPIVIHGRTTLHGMNPALSGQLEKNIELFQESLDFYEYLNAEKIIMHPGVGGRIENTVEFINHIKVSGLIVENKPHLALDYRICNGASPAEIKFVMDETGIGFCLDLSHAIKYACSSKLDYLDVIGEFESFQPEMYHICDSDPNTEMDEHRNIGKGQFDFKSIFSIINLEKLMTVETNKSGNDFYDEFLEDRAILNESF